MYDKFFAARALREIAELSRLLGENPYKVRAYDRGARALLALTADLDALIRERRLTEVSGIGAALAGQIVELVGTGQSNLLNSLRARLPPGAAELSRVPGMTLRRVQALHAALGIENREQLQEACVTGQVRTVRGFSEKLEQRLLTSLASPPRATMLRLVDAHQEFGRVAVEAMATGMVREVALVGEARRYLEVVSGLEVAVCAEQVTAVRHALATVPAQIYVVPPEHWGGALAVFTGPEEHVLWLSERAQACGLTLTDLGELRRGDDTVAADTEQAFYRALGLEWMPPELRGTEHDRRAVAPGLLELQHLRGVVHCHTTYSDGTATIEQMARAAAALGMSYITITDHSPAAFYAQGVSIEGLQRQWEEIAEVQQRVPIQILRGTESDILEDGALDFPDHILEQLDVIIASVHSRFKLDREQTTRRLIRAVEHPLFKIWGHALGRLIERREPLACDVERVLDAAANARVAIEINADPHRLDLAPEWVSAARVRGIPLVISADAHSPRGFDVLHYGVGIARRAGVRAQEVLNTLNADEFAARVRPG